jgi:hypothetical protein
MKLDKLTITGFRGIPGPLELDLGARVTVLHGANGTGKTSIVDAARVLLLGPPDRLKGVDLACRGSGSEPEVIGVYGSETLRWRPDGVAARKGARWVKEKAPIRLVGGPSRPNRSAVHLQHWLDGTRFLGRDTLARLVDEDVDPSRRREVWAELMGLGGLSTELRGRELLAQKLRAAAAEADREVAVLPPVARPGPGLDELWAEVRGGLDLVDTNAVDVRAAELRLGARRADLEAATAAFERWASQPEPGPVDAPSRDALDAAKVEVVAAEAAHRQAEEAVRVARLEQQEHERRAEAARRRLARCAELEEAREVLEIAADDTWAGVRADREALAERLRRLTDQLAAWDGAGASRAEAELVAARQAEAAARAAVDAVRGVYDRFVASATAVLTRATDPHCPLCATPFDDVAALRAAAAAATAAASSQVRALQEAAEVAGDALGAAQIERVRWGKPRGRPSEEPLEALRERVVAGAAEAQRVTEHLAGRDRLIELLRALGDGGEQDRERTLRTWPGWLEGQHQEARAAAREAAEGVTAAAEEVARAGRALVEARATADAASAAFEAAARARAEREAAVARRAAWWAAAALPVEAPRDVQARLMAEAGRLDRLASRVALVREVVAADEGHRLRRRRDRLYAVLAEAEAAAGWWRGRIAAIERDHVDPLVESVSALFARAQGNRVVERVLADITEEGVVWRAELRSGSTLRSKELSDGQRQDLALAIFLAQARTLQGTFFLDEPLLHLDDVNTVGVIDVFRVLAMEDRDLRLVVTTANERLVRLFEEKFRPVDVPGRVALRVIELEGNPRVGVTARVRDVGGG